MWTERGLIEKRTVVDSFRELWISAGLNESNFRLTSESRIPPMLARYLAFGIGDTANFQPANSSCEATFGSGEIVTATVTSLATQIEVLHSGLDPQLLKSLGIEGYQYVDLQSELLCQVTSALELLENVDAQGDRGLISPLHEFLTALIFLEEAAKPQRPIVSSSFPELPFVAFMSQDALFQIPPSGRLLSNSPYALAENLFHESIHQQVNLTILFSDVFTLDYEALKSPRISVPWRNAYWELDRAFHAVIVYSGLISMRRRSVALLDKFTSAQVTRSAQEAYDVHEYLASQVIANSHYLTQKGQEIIREFSKPLD